MFFLKELHHVVELLPSLFTNAVEDQLRRRLLDEVEGLIDPRIGYIVAVVDVISIGAGVVLPAQGSAQYAIHYLAVVFKPFIGQVVDAVVTKISDPGVLTEVGPVEIFIAKALVPESFKYEPRGGSTCYEDKDANQRIEANSRVRLRIVNTMTTSDKINCIGTMRGDGLGLISG
ncbi:hypothetical protein BC828DRAFT_405441 [Blastocladiella britannica]|nr:hypothetical protein BC828DRAFT_405441 [Blastocladiella britannica]